MNVYDLEEELERHKARREQKLGAALDRTQLNEEVAGLLKEVRRIVTRSTSVHLDHHAKLGVVLVGGAVCHAEELFSSCQRTEELAIEDKGTYNCRRCHRRRS